MSTVLNNSGERAPQHPPASEEHNPGVFTTAVRALGELSIVRSDSEISPGIVTANWEACGVVKSAPRFGDLAGDNTRQNTITYVAPSMPRSARTPMPGIVTESEGLQELHELLSDFISNRPTGARAAREKARATDMLENLTYIGGREYSEAVRGIGLVWKAHLTADSRRKICILTEVGSLDMYRGIRKSDAHLKNEILESFTDEELARYSGRIVERVEDLDDNVEHGTIVMLDDWIISGEQMSKTFNRLTATSTSFSNFVRAGKVAAHVIVASSDRVQDGLRIGDSAHILRISAYYQAHRAQTMPRLGNSIISGSHSSVNYGFGSLCSQIVTTAQHYKGRPRLAHVVRSYRDQLPTIEITTDTLRRIPSDELRAHKAILLAGSLTVQEESCR